MAVELTATQFIEDLKAHQAAVEPGKTESGEHSERDRFSGVRMGQIFALAKTHIQMPADEIEKLLESPIHRVRVGALSIMNQQARLKKTTPEQRKILYDLYIRRIAHINTWDLVDLAAPYVVGGYLFDKPRDVLFNLARSEDFGERRTAIVSTLYFVRMGDVEDVYRIADLLLNDKQDLIHKATGWALRAAGDRDRARLLAYLDQHAATMPRTTLRYALEHVTPEQKVYYMGLKKGK